MQAVRHMLGFISQAAGQSVLSRCRCLEVGAHAVEVIQHIVQLRLAVEVC